MNKFEDSEQQINGKYFQNTPLRIKNKNKVLGESDHQKKSDEDDVKTVGKLEHDRSRHQLNLDGGTLAFNPYRSSDSKLASIKNDSGPDFENRKTRKSLRLVIG